MQWNFDSDAPPLRVDKHGVCRVSGTRVTLESILTGFRQGETPEQIHEAFPAVPLSDVYAAIAYYLKHRDHLDGYLKQTEEAEQRVEAAIDLQPPRALRGKVEAARRKLVSS